MQSRQCQFFCPPCTNASGEWCCHVCGNINLPCRRRCHLQVCQAPLGFPGPYTKPMPGAPLPHAMAIRPWKCPVCQNDNRPSRDVCHRRGCTARRPEDPSAGLGAAFHTAAASQTFELHGASSCVVSAAPLEEDYASSSMVSAMPPPMPAPAQQYSAAPSLAEPPLYVWAANQPQQRQQQQHPNYVYVQSHPPRDVTFVTTQQPIAYGAPQQQQYVLTGSGQAPPPPPQVVFVPQQPNMFQPR